jgi:peptidoglycan/xylan/chitin deacetylase (PgdA/CDA1 family)
MIRHALAPHVPSAAASLGVPRVLPPSASGVALTFDDGPHPEGTPAVLEVLAGAGARATFFLIGEQVERRPALVREIVEGGHLVALHGYKHSLQLRLSSGAVRADVVRGKAVVEDAAGTSVHHHRPPYGLYSAAGLAVVRASGMEPMLWSRWGKDWRKFTTADRIAARVTTNVGPRDIILLHDADFYSAKGSHQHTVIALKTILTALDAAELDTVLAV